MFRVVGADEKMWPSRRPGQAQTRSASAQAQVRLCTRARILTLVLYVHLILATDSHSLHAHRLLRWSLFNDLEAGNTFDALVRAVSSRSAKVVRGTNTMFDIASTGQWVRVIVQPRPVRVYAVVRFIHSTHTARHDSELGGIEDVAATATCSASPSISL